MKEPLTFTPEAVGQRLDKWLAEQDTLDLTRSVIQTRMEQGDVTVNGVAVSKNYKIRSGDVVQVVIPEPVSLELVPEPIPLDIVYEDDDLLVVKKCVSRRKIPRMPLHIIPCWRSPATIRICGYSSKRAERIKFGCI